MNWLLHIALTRIPKHFNVYLINLKNKNMKILNSLALICSLLCIVTSLIQHDYTEALAWFIVTMYNSKDFINDLK